MPKALKIVLIVVLALVFVVGGGVAAFAFYLDNQVKKNSCYALELKKTDSSVLYDVDIFSQAFNSAGKVTLSKTTANGLLYTGKNTANNLQVDVSKDTISVKNTEAVGWDGAKKEFSAGQMGVAVGAALGQSNQSINSITDVAGKIGASFDSASSYKTTTNGWDISFTSACS